MVLNTKPKSLIEQSRQLEPNCNQSYPFIFFTNPSLEETKNANKGWKLHISVAIEDLEKAFGLIAPILRENFYRFKVIDIQRYKFVLIDDKNSATPYGTFSITDYGDNFEYRLRSKEGNVVKEILEKASLGLPVDQPLTIEHLENIQDALLKHAVSKGHIDNNDISGLMVHKHPDRFTLGTQFTIRLTEDKNNVPHLDIGPLIQQVSEILTNNGIKPGVRPASDAPIKDTAYFSIRNSCIAFGESFDELYVAASDIGHLYNPALRINPYAHLIPEQNLGPQNILAHCEAILELPNDGLRTGSLKDVLILFSFLHQHLKLDLLDSEEEMGFILESLMKGDFSPLESKGLWKEGHNSEEIRRELQGIAIYQSFVHQLDWISEKQASFSNRIVSGNLQALFQLIEQKKSVERTDKPNIFFEEYYIKSVHGMHLEKYREYNNKNDKKELNTLLNAIKAWPIFSQQMRQYGYDDFQIMDKISLSLEYSINPNLKQWFYEEISKIPDENNVIMQCYLLTQYLEAGPYFTASLEKIFELIQKIKQSGIDELVNQANELLTQLGNKGLLDEQGNLKPYFIDEQGKAHPVESSKESSSLSHGQSSFFNNMPASSSSSSSNEHEEDIKDENPSTRNKPS